MIPTARAKRTSVSNTSFPKEAGFMGAIGAFFFGEVFVVEVRLYLIVSPWTSCSPGSSAWRWIPIYGKGNG
jgi:hypothetical protein